LAVPFLLTGHIIAGKKDILLITGTSQLEILIEEDASLFLIKTLMPLLK